MGNLVIAIIAAIGLSNKPFLYNKSNAIVNNMKVRDMAIMFFNIFLLSWERNKNANIINRLKIIPTDALIIDSDKIYITFF